MMCPYQKADQGNPQGGHGYPPVSEQRLARKHRQKLRDDAQTWKHEHIHRRVGIEPEQMLEEHRVTTFGWVEEAHTKQTLEHHELEGKADQLRGSQSDNGCGN